MAGGYADLMQQFGLADSLQAMYVKKQTDAAEAEINAGNYVMAFQVCYYAFYLFMPIINSEN